MDNSNFPTLRAANTLNVFTSAMLHNDVLPELYEAVAGVIVAGLTIIVGAAKIGKSWFALQMANAIATGSDFLGFCTTKSGVLYLALEDSKQRLQSRCRDYQQLDNLYFYNDPCVWNAAFKANLESFLHEHTDVRVIIVDTMQKIRSVSTEYAVTAYEREYREISQYKDFADAHGIALVMLHHKNKTTNTADIFDQINGSNAISGVADSIIMLNRARGKNVAYVNCIGRDIESMELVLQFDDTHWSFVSSDSKRWKQEQSTTKCQSDYSASPLAALLKQMANDACCSGKAAETITYADLSSRSGLDVSTADIKRQLNRFMQFLHDDGIIIRLCVTLGKNKKGISIAYNQVTPAQTQMCLTT